jgi:hypothetical protein
MAFTICPKCHFEEPSATACSRCGTVFEQWYSEHQPAPAREPEAVVAEALRKLDQLRIIEVARSRRRRRIAQLIVLAAIAVAILIVVVQLRRLFANA